MRHAQTRIAERARQRLRQRVGYVVQQMVAEARPLFAGCDEDATGTRCWSMQAARAQGMLPALQVAIQRAAGGVSMAMDEESRRAQREAFLKAMHGVGVTLLHLGKDAAIQDRHPLTIGGQRYESMSLDTWLHDEAQRALCEADSRAELPLLPGEPVEPVAPDRRLVARVVIREPDGRVWVVEEQDLREASYFADCPRDEGGRCLPSGTAGASGTSRQQVFTPVVRVTPIRRRVFDGAPRETTAKLSKQETGALAEHIATAWLQHQGFADAAPMNLAHSNFPIDLVQDHEVIEVKAGVVSNGPGAQQWRLTIGQPGKAESAWLATASPAAKERWNAKKQAAITARKKQVLAQVSQELGRAVKPRTMTLVIDPDRRTADLYSFAGWHDRIGWKSDEAKAAYVGTVRYAQRG